MAKKEDKDFIDKMSRAFGPSGAAWITSDLAHRGGKALLKAGPLASRVAPYLMNWHPGVTLAALVSTLGYDKWNSLNDTEKQQIIQRFQGQAPKIDAKERKQARHGKRNGPLAK